MNGQSRMERHLAGYESATTVMSSELETTSFCDSDDDDTMSRLEAWGERRWATPCFVFFFFFLKVTLMSQGTVKLLNAVVFLISVLCMPDAEVNVVCRFSSSTEQSTASRLLKRHRRRRKQRPPRLERVLLAFIIWHMDPSFCISVFLLYLLLSFRHHLSVVWQTQLCLWISSQSLSTWVSMFQCIQVHEISSWHKLLL